MPDAIPVNGDPQRYATLPSSTVSVRVLAYLEWIVRPIGRRSQPQIPIQPPGLQPSIIATDTDLPGRGPLFEELFGVDFLEQNEWERDSLLLGNNGADGITWTITRVVRPTQTPFVGAYVQKDKRGPINCSIYDHGDFCLYSVASSEWNYLAPHISSGPQSKKR